MSDVFALANPDTINPLFVAVAVRLADEGVPLGAIARALQTPSELVREALHNAHEHGHILSMPKEDWPPTSIRDKRAPMQARKMDDGDIVRNCVRLFKVTHQQASLLSVLIRRPEVSKDMMHQIIEENRAANKNEATDPKIVDVVICNLRKRLKETKLKGTIETMWGCGYFMKPDNQKLALDLLGGYANAKLETTP